MIAEKLEDSLRGGYGGLYGEVVTADCYQLKKLKFIPRVVYDLGCNVGVFTSFVKTLFPDAKVYAIEPDEENYLTFEKFVLPKFDGIKLFRAAIGKGEVYRHIKAINGAHEFYATVGLGYDKKSLEENPETAKVPVASLLPDVFINKYGTEASVAKIDIEGAETHIFTHPPSMEALKKIDYIAMEVHNNASDGSTIQAVRDKTFEAMRSFEATHDCQYIHPIFLATKKVITIGGKILTAPPQINYRKELGKLLDHFSLPRTVAEIGVAEGRFSEVICSWGVDKIYLVDNWNTIPNQPGDGSHPQSWHDINWKESHERTAACVDKTVFLRGMSRDMAASIPDKSLGMVYIDCNHAKEAVMEDLHTYYPKIVSGGIIAGHDYLNLNYGVNRAVKEFCGSVFEINVIPDEEPNMASFWFQKK